jgi:hypothetical protein
MKSIVLAFFVTLLGWATASCTGSNLNTSAPVVFDLDLDWSCQFPTDVPASDAGQQAFDEYSWKMFVALNWPAQSGQRGKPDCNQVIGESSPVVWETYKSVDQIFLPNAKNPGPWNSTLTTANLTSINIAALKNSSVVASVDQAVGGWLIDQHSNPTYYQILANEISYDYIVTNDFYNADVVSKANNILFPNDTTEIKASWQILKEGNDNFSRYLTMAAKVAEFNPQGQPTGNMLDATLGLVGLHIITKAEGYPQWIWATFEQVDNVPPKVNDNGQWKDDPQSNIDYSYYDAAAASASVNQSPCDWQRNGNSLTCVPKAGQTFETPDPLDRVAPIASETRAVNLAAQMSLKTSVFQYYQLITTQRPLMPDNPSNPLGQPTPALSANVTLESYIQSESSCMNCHSIATPVNSLYKSDFSYLFKFAQSPEGKTH